MFLVSPKPEGYQDDFLIRADKNPNSKGAELLGFKYGESYTQNKFDGIVVFGQDLNLKGEKWSLFIGSNHNTMSEQATYVLSSATYAEKEGTFTNFEGRIQKFEKALAPLGESRPESEILIALADGLGINIGPVPAYETLKTGSNDIRLLAEPVIPALEQETNIL